MATAIRQSVQDFITAVSSRGINGGTSKNLYSAAVNSDNITVQVLKNGNVIFPKVLWPGTGSSPSTDASGTNNDSVTVFAPDGTTSTGAAQSFINSLV